MKVVSKKSFLITIIIFGVVTLSWYAFAWTTPTADPPASNLPAPINEGSDTQTKSGGLNISGDVGIATTTPSQALDIVGSLELEDTTTSTMGVIYKGSDPFIHNFHHPTGDTAVPDGQNTFVGVNAGNFTMGSTATASSQASYNTGIGVNTLHSNTTGYYNSAMGYNALYSNTTGYSNSAIGENALYKNTTGKLNFAAGDKSMYSNTTGSYNFGAGAMSLYHLTGGFFNLALGYSAGYRTTGNSNTAIGPYALYSNTSGSQNIAIGDHALFSNTTYSINTAIGYQAMQKVTGTGNTAIGGYAGVKISDGSYNTTPNYSTYIGYNSAALADGDQNEIVIGYNATGIGSNSVVLGNDNITTTALKGNVGIGTTSPEYSFDVIGNSRISRGNVTRGDGELFIQRGTEGKDIAGVLFGEYGDTNATSSNFFIGHVYKDGSTTPNLHISKSPIWEDSSGSIVDVPWVTIDTSGNVGIGTTGPNGKLDVEGSGNVILNAGNVGIGTTSPASKLTVKLSATDETIDTLDAFPTIQINNTGSYYNQAASFKASKSVASGVTDDGYIVGFWGQGFAYTNHAGTLANTYGGVVNTGIYDSNDSGGTVTTAHGLRLGIYAHGGSITTAKALEILAPSISGNNGSIGTSYAIYQAGGSDINYFAGNVGIGTTSPGSYKLKVDAGGSGNAGIGVNGYIKATGDITANTSLDLAERFPIDVSCLKNHTCPQPGEVVAIKEGQVIERTNQSYQPDLIGVVSTKPGFVLAGGYNKNNSVPIALSGRVPVKVSLENGPIKIGDPLTSSSIPGVAMKATKSGRVIGIALESLSGKDFENCKSKISRILVFVNPHWNGGNIKENGTLTVDTLKTKKLCIGNTCVTEKQLKELLGKNIDSGNR